MSILTRRVIPPTDYMERKQTGPISIESAPNGTEDMNSLARALTVD